MRLSWNGEGQKYYTEFTGTPHLISLNWWQQSVTKSDLRIEKFQCSRYLLQSNKNDTNVPGEHRNTILLNISVKGYTLYAGVKK